MSAATITNEIYNDNDSIDHRTAAVNIRPVESDHDDDDDEHPTLARASGLPTAGGSAVNLTSSGRLSNTTSAEFYRQTVQPRHRAVYDAYGNEVGYNKGLPHKRHPEIAAAMDRYISLSSSGVHATNSGSGALHKTSSGSQSKPTTEEFNNLVRTQSKGTFSSHPENSTAKSNGNSPDGINSSPSAVLLTSPSGTLSPSGPHGPRIKDATPESTVKLPWYERAADKIMGRRHVEKKSRLGRVLSKPAIVENSNQAEKSVKR